MSIVRGWAREVRTVLASSPGFATVLHSIGVPKAMGIAWHGVSSNDLYGLDNYSAKHVSVRQFEEQLKTILSRFRIVSATELVGFLESGSALPRRLAFLTFDDGYRGLYDFALDVLRKHKVPAIVFLPTSFIGGQRLAEDLLDAAVKYSSESEIHAPDNGTKMVLPLSSEAQKLEACRVLRQHFRHTSDHDHETRLDSILAELGFKSRSEVPQLNPTEEPLTWQQIREMLSEEIEFGSHSHFHHSIASLSGDELVKDLRTSKKIIESNIGRSCDLFAYPYGNPKFDANNETARGVQTAGFRAAFLTGNGYVRRNSNLFALRRNCITAATREIDLRAILATAGHSLLHRDRY